MNSIQPRKVTRDYAYHNIKNQIINGELCPDQTVVEDQLAKELEISKTPLREALQRLEIEDLVIRQPNGRLKVAPITVQEVGELFHVRSNLEAIIAKQAAENATPEEIERLKEFCGGIAEAAKHNDREQILHTGSVFHNHLYKMSGNKTVVNILGMLNGHIARYRRLIPHGDIMLDEKEVEEHYKILNHIINSECEEAGKAMEEHVLNSMSTAIMAIETYKAKRETM